MNDLAGKAKAIFLDAIEHYAPEQWAFYLDEACAGDGSLRARVDKLLRARAQLGSFHEACEPSLVATADGQPVSEGPGTIIGPYKLLEQIGEGGMGLVFVAEQQQPIKRRVALKIIKPGMDSRQVIARFEAERQALALMDHPHIAKVHDGGATPEGRPYFVMELVKGAPITAYCDTHRLSTHQRLELFLAVCHAVQHAHHKGIIHRDLKPSNVLVSRHDTVPVVKVIDFGIAKATSGQLTEKTVYTACAQMVGTPLYMSPEQAGLSDIDVDTRSDVYSLGVLLYELLTGMTPFDSETLKKASYDELRRIIREDEPPRPSTRLSTIEQAARSTIAERRGLEPYRLSLQLRGELDWVVMKALEKDCNCRYESASAFAADVQRYLHDEPVHACPPSAGYRLRRFARKHKAALATAGLVAAALLLGTAVSIWQAIEANRARQRAEANFTLARQAVDEMYTQVAEKWLAEQPHMTDVQRQLLQKALKAYQSFAQQAGNEPAVRLETARAYKRVGDIQRTLGANSEAQTAYRAALQILEPLAAAFPTVPQYRDDLARSLNNLGNVLSHTGRRAEAEAAYCAAVKLEEQLADVFPTVPQYRQRLAGFDMNLGNLLTDNGRRAEAEKVHRAALTILEQLSAEFPAAPENRAQLAQIQVSLGCLLLAIGRHADAETAFRAAVKLHERLVAEFSAVPQYRDGLANCYNDLGLLLRDNGKPAEAEMAHRAAVKLRKQLAADFPTVAEYRQELAGLETNLGDLLLHQGKYAKAETAYRHGLELQEELVTKFPTVPSYRNDLAHSHTNLGTLLVDTGRRGEAEAGYRAAIGILEPLAKEHPNVSGYRKELANCYNNLGGLLQDTGRHAQAEQAYRAALEIKQTLAAAFPTVPQYRQGLAHSYDNLGMVLGDTGKRADAETAFRAALKLEQALATEFPSVPKYRADLARSRNNIGNMLGDRGKSTAAVAELRAAQQIREQLVADLPAVPEYRQQLAESHNNLGIQFVLLGRHAEAETAFRAALMLREKLVADFPTALEYAVDLGVTYWSLGKLELEQTKGESATAFESLAKAIHILRAVLAKEEHHLRARKFLVGAYRERIGARLQRHQYAEALPDFDRAIELAEGSERDYFRVHRAITLFRTGQIAQAVAEADSLTQGKNLTGETLYNAACFYALASAARKDNSQQAESNAVKAMALLGRAQAAGYFEDSARIAYLKQDTDFDALRARGDYQRLIQGLEKKTEQAGK